MKKIKRLISAMVFLAGIVVVFDIVFPGTLSNVKESPLITPFIEKVDSFTKKSKKDFEEVLGSTNNNGGFSSEEAADAIKNISSQVLESEAGQTAQEQIGQVLNQATEEIKDLPEQQVKKIKGEVKRQICDEMLKDY